jgi:tripartite-type tricarboxylate transporter receptor subunit TctC
MALSSYVVNPALYAKLPYDPHKDFAPITLAVSTPTALVVNPAVPASTVQDLVAFIKENRSKYGFAHGGVGTQGHLTGEQFRMKLGLDLVAVPFGGGGPAIASVLGGHTPIGFIALGAAASSIKSGQLRALAVTGKNRSPLLARVPTMTEAGYPDIVGDNWVGVLAPAGTPKEITSLLHREITESLRDPQIKGVLGELGYEVVATSPKEFAERITSEIDTWGNVIRTANIKMQ